MHAERMAARRYHRRLSEVLFVTTILEAFRRSRLDNRPIRQEDDKEPLAQRSFGRVRKANEPEGNRTCPEFLRFQCSDLEVVKGHHKVRSYLSRFLFGYRVG